MMRLVVLLVLTTTVGANPCPPSTDYTQVGTGSSNQPQHVCVPQYGIGDNKLVCDYNTCPADLGTCGKGPTGDGPRACHPNNGTSSKQTSTQQLDAFKDQAVTVTHYCDLSVGGCKGVIMPCNVNTTIDQVRKYSAHGMQGHAMCHDGDGNPTSDCWSLAAVPTRLMGNIQDMMTAERDKDGSNKPYGYIQSGTHQGLSTSSGMCYNVTRNGRTVHLAVTDRCAGYCRGQPTYVDKHGNTQSTTTKQREIQECSQVNRFNAQEIKTHTTCVCDQSKLPFDTSSHVYSPPSFLNISILGVPDTCLDNPKHCCGREGAPAFCVDDTCNNVVEDGGNGVGYVKCDHCATQLAMEFDLDIAAYKYLCDVTGPTSSGSAGSCKVDTVTPFRCSEPLTVPSGLDGRSGTTNVNCPTLVAEPIPPTPQRKNVFCYVENWAQWRKTPARPDDWANTAGPELDATQCTHIVWAFGDVCSHTLDAGTPRRNSMEAQRCKTGSGGSKQVGEATFFEDSDPANIRDSIKAWRKTNPDVKILWSVGGWGFGPRRLSEIVQDTAKRAIFIASVKKIIQDFGFDGFDWDWEYPGTGCATTQEKIYPHNCDKTFIDDDRAAFGQAIDDLHTAFNEINATHPPTQHIAVHAFRWHNYPIEHLRDPTKIATVGLMSYDLAGAFSTCAAGNSPLYPESAGCQEAPDDVDGRTWLRDAFSIHGALDVWSRGNKTLTGAALYAQGTNSSEGPAIPKNQLHGGVAFYARYGRTKNDNDTNVQPGNSTRSSTSGVDSPGNPASCFGVRSLEPGTEFFASYSGVHETMLGRDGSPGVIDTKMLGERSTWNYVMASTPTTPSISVPSYAYTTFDCPVKASTVACNNDNDCGTGLTCKPQPYMPTAGAKACSKTASHFASFDDECTMSAKGHYFTDTQPGKDYGGVIVWAYTHDEFRDGRYGIMRALHAGFAGTVYDTAKCKMDACVDPDATCGEDPNLCKDCFMSARRPVRGQKTCRPCISEECTNGQSSCTLGGNGSDTCMFFSPRQKMCYATKSQFMECCTGVPPVDTGITFQSECDIHKYNTSLAQGPGINDNCLNYDNSDPCDKCRNKNGCFGYDDLFCQDSIWDPAQCTTQAEAIGCKPKAQCHPEECKNSRLLPEPGGCELKGDAQSAGNVTGGQGGQGENTDNWCAYKAHDGASCSTTKAGGYIACTGEAPPLPPTPAPCPACNAGVDCTSCSGFCHMPGPYPSEFSKTHCNQPGMPPCDTRGKQNNQCYPTGADFSNIELYECCAGAPSPAPPPAPTSTGAGQCTTTFNADDSAPPLPDCWCVPVATGINLMRMHACANGVSLAFPTSSDPASSHQFTWLDVTWLANLYNPARNGVRHQGSIMQGYDPGQGHDLGDNFGTLSNTAGPTCGTLLKDVPSGIQQACAEQLHPATCTTTWVACTTAAQPAVFDAAIASTEPSVIVGSPISIANGVGALVQHIDTKLQLGHMVFLHLRSWGVDAASQQYVPTVTIETPYYVDADVVLDDGDVGEFTGHTVAVVAVDVGTETLDLPNGVKMNAASHAANILGVTTSEVVAAQATPAPTPLPTPPTPSPTPFPTPPTPSPTPFPTPPTPSPTLSPTSSPPTPLPTPDTTQSPSTTSSPTPFPTPPIQSIDHVITRAQFNTIFGKAATANGCANMHNSCEPNPDGVQCPVYGQENAYDNFVAAVHEYGLFSSPTDMCRPERKCEAKAVDTLGFISDGDDVVKKKELAAFISNVFQETGFHECTTLPSGLQDCSPWINKGTPKFHQLGNHVDMDDDFTPQWGTDPKLQKPLCYSSETSKATNPPWYGRGIMQLTSENNYYQATYGMTTFDNIAPNTCASAVASGTIIQDPPIGTGLNLCADKVLPANNTDAAWRTGIWFWMNKWMGTNEWATAKYGQQTAHNVLVHTFQQHVDSFGEAFAASVKVINGGEECLQNTYNGDLNSGDGFAKTVRRANAYVYALNQLGVPDYYSDWDDKAVWRDAMSQCNTGGKSTSQQFRRLQPCSIAQYVPHEEKYRCLMDVSTVEEVPINRHFLCPGFAIGRNATAGPNKGYFHTYHAGVDVSTTDTTVQWSTSQQGPYDMPPNHQNIKTAWNTGADTFVQCTIGSNQYRYKIELQHFNKVKTAERTYRYVATVLKVPPKPATSPTTGLDACGTVYHVDTTRHIAPCFSAALALGQNLMRLKSCVNPNNPPSHTAAHPGALQPQWLNTAFRRGIASRTSAAVTDPAQIDLTSTAQDLGTVLGTSAVAGETCGTPWQNIAAATHAATLHTFGAGAQVSTRWDYVLPTSASIVASANVTAHQHNSEAELCASMQSNCATGQTACLVSVAHGWYGTGANKQWQRPAEADQHAHWADDAASLGGRTGHTIEVLHVECATTSNSNENRRLNTACNMTATTPEGEVCLDGQVVGASSSNLVTTGSSATTTPAPEPTTTTTTPAPEPTTTTPAPAPEPEPTTTTTTPAPAPEPTTTTPAPEPEPTTTTPAPAPEPTTTTTTTTSTSSAATTQPPPTPKPTPPAATTPDPSATVAPPSGIVGSTTSSILADSDDTSDDSSSKLGLGLGLGLGLPALAALVYLGHHRRGNTDSTQQPQPAATSPRDDSRSAGEINDADSNPLIRPNTFSWL